MTVTELGIGHVGLSDMDVQRLKAVMRMAITNGALTGRWHLREPQQAHLVVVGPESKEGLAMIAAHPNSRNKHFAVLAGEADRVDVGCDRLPWPIRLESLLALLKKVERRVARAGAPEPVRASSGVTENHLVRLAALLRDGGESADNIAWRVAGIHRRSLYIVPGQRAFYFGDSLAALRQVDSSVQLEFVPVPVEQLPDQQSKKPIVMLQWLVGLLTGPLGLLPWINPQATLQLRRFPEFQMLYHGPPHRRMAAALARPLAGVDAIASLTGLDATTVIGFVNASNLCGYLHTVEGRAAAPSVAKATGSSKRLLFQTFRKALGIATADA